MNTEHQLLKVHFNDDFAQNCESISNINHFSEFVIKFHAGYDVILNRRVFMRNASLPTNYTVFYKFMRSQLGGEIAYVGINVNNCVSNFILIVLEFSIAF